MKLRMPVVSLVLVVFCLAPVSAQDLGKILGGLLGQESNEEQDSGETRAGLKEALRIGAERAIASASKEDGFLGNELIRIPIADDMEKVARTMRRIGLSSTVDAFEESMNRAAERASAEAVPIFADAVSSLTIDDAVAILSGGEHAATELLRSKTEAGLSAAFRPVIDRSMAEVGVTEHYDRLMAKAGPYLSIFGTQETDLSIYVTNGALDGLFSLLASEEAKIRDNPAARSTELLQRVFGSVGVGTAVGAMASSGSGERSDASSAIEEEIEGFLVGYRAAYNAADTDAIRKLYVDDERFAVFENGELRYTTPQAIVDAIAGIPAGTRMSTRGFDTRITILTENLVSASMGYETEMTMADGSGFGFQGVSTMLLERGADGWRVVNAHSSSPPQRAEGGR